MQLANDANTERKFFQASDAMFQSNDVIADLTQILRAAFDSDARFSREQFTERGLCALNLA